VKDLAFWLFTLGFGAWLGWGVRGVWKDDE
jgi:hypothetical protein